MYHPWETRFMLEIRTKEAGYDEAGTGATLVEGDRRQICRSCRPTDSKYAYSPNSRLQMTISMYLLNHDIVHLFRQSRTMSRNRGKASAGLWFINSSVEEVIHS